VSRSRPFAVKEPLLNRWEPRRREEVSQLSHAELACPFSLS